MNKYKLKFDEVIKVNSLKKQSGIISLINKDCNKLSICKRLNIPKIDSFSFDIIYKKLNANVIIANYSLYAEGEQKCVISLKPVKFKIKEKFSIKFSDHSQIELSVLEDEFIEPIYNDEINFCDIAVQMLPSFLDPYPKINNGDIELENVYKNNLSSNKSKNNPFEVLNNLNK